MCKYCVDTPESILHLNWHCPVTVAVWGKVLLTFQDLYDITITLEAQITRYLFGKLDEGRDTIPSVFDIMCSFTKNYIYCLKCNEDKSNIPG